MVKKYFALIAFCLLLAVFWSVRVFAFNSTSSNFSLLGDVGYVGGTSTSTIFFILNEGQVSALGLISSTQFMINAGLIPQIFQGISSPAKSSYTYRRTITISPALISPVSGTALSNFPVLISGTYSGLAASSSGGFVQNANGYDIMFASDASGTQKLAFETESYSSTTGALVDWVNVPTLSSSSNVIYMFYDSTSTVTDQSSAVGTWDSNYRSVWHLPNGTTLSALDSTANGNNGTISGVNATSGQMDGAALSSGNNYIGLSGPALGSTATATLSAWVDPDGTHLGSPESIISDNGGSNALELNSNKAAFFAGGQEGTSTNYAFSSPKVYWDIAFDGTNMWTSNANSNSVTKISPTGTVIGTYSLGGPTTTNSIAFDGTNMWVGNYGGNSVSKISPTGTVIGTYTSSSLRGPQGIAFDGTNMWTANYSSYNVTEISPTGTIIAAYPTSSFLNAPQDIAFDGTNMWTSSAISNSVTKISPTGTVIATYSSSSINGPYGIAFDGINMWTANYVGMSVSKISPTGTITTYAVGDKVKGIAFDGTNMWAPYIDFPNYGVVKISLSGATSFFVNGIQGGLGIAFDGANMWVALPNVAVAKVPIGAYSFSTIPANSWTYVASTIDAAGNNNMYVNGVLNQNCVATILPLNVCGSNSTVRKFGGTMADLMNNSNTTPFYGAIDEARVSNVVRSPDWIATEYQNQSSPNSFYSMGGQTPPSSQSITLTMSSTVALPTLSPGTAVTASTTLTVTTAGASAGYTMWIQRNSATSTLSSSTVTFPDYTPLWGPSGTTCSSGEGNGTTTPGKTFSFRVQSVNTTANYCSFWWGSNDTTNAIYAGVPTSTQEIVNSTSSASQNGTTAVSILYRADAPSSQPVGSYGGSVTITAIANP